MQVGNLKNGVDKVKVKLSLCLTKHHIMKVYLLLNYSPCHEDMGVEV